MRMARFSRFAGKRPSAMASAVYDSSVHPMRSRYCLVCSAEYHEGCLRISAPPRRVPVIEFIVEGMRGGAGALGNVSGSSPALS